MVNRSYHTKKFWSSESSTQEWHRNKFSAFSSALLSLLKPSSTVKHIKAYNASGVDDLLPWSVDSNIMCYWMVRDFWRSLCLSIAHGRLGLFLVFCLRVHNGKPFTLKVKKSVDKLVLYLLV